MNKDNQLKLNNLYLEAKMTSVSNKSPQVYLEYGYFKHKLEKLDISSDEFNKAIIKIARILKV